MVSAEPSPLVPTLAAGSLVLRPFVDRDVALVLAAGRDPLIPLVTTVPPTADPESAAAWIARQAQRTVDGTGHSFAIADAATDEALGQIGLWTFRSGPGVGRVGYWVGRAHRRRGIAGRALTAITAWGFAERGLARIELSVEPWNEGSWRAAESAGFRREGLVRGAELVGDERRDMYLYGRLASEATG